MSTFGVFYQYCGLTKSAMVGGSTCTWWSVQTLAERTSYSRSGIHSDIYGVVVGTRKKRFAYVRRGGGHRANLQHQRIPFCRHHRIQGSVPVSISERRELKQRENYNRSILRDSKPDCAVRISRVPSAAEIPVWGDISIPMNVVATNGGGGV